MVEVIINKAGMKGKTPPKDAPGTRVQAAINTEAAPGGMKERTVTPDLARNNREA